MAPDQSWTSEGPAGGRVLKGAYASDWILVGIGGVVWCVRDDFDVCVTDLDLYVCAPSAACGVLVSCQL